MSAPIVLAAGGTGGHLFPAEAVAAELHDRGRAVHLLTDARADAFAGRAAGIAVHRVRAGRFAGGPVDAAQGLAEVAIGIVQARRLLRRLAPAVVVGFGGYPSVPTMLAASLLGLPIMIHEQNAVLGRANRLLAPRARRIATSFPETEKLRPAEGARAVRTGNPVRAAILAVDAAGYRPPAAAAPIEILVMGGSQGAHVFAGIVPAALKALPAPLRVRLRVGQQARPEDLATAAAAYAETGIAVELASFFTDVPERLARAHVVVGRAGASTVAELAAAGRPALLVPYPHAVDHHQTANARAFAAFGGGWAIAQAELTPATLARHLEELLEDPERLTVAARQAAVFGRRNAARDLARLVLDLEAGAPALGCAA